MSGVVPKNLLHTRIASKIKKSDETVWNDINLQNRISISIRKNIETKSNLSEFNSFYVKKPPRITFTLAIESISGQSNYLRRIFATDTMIDFMVSDVTSNTNIENSGNTFSLGKEELQNCLLSEKSFEVSVGDSPVTVYNGIALRGLAYTVNGDEFVYGSGIPEKDGFGGESMSWNDIWESNEGE